LGDFIAPDTKNQVRPQVRASSYAVNGWLLNWSSPAYPHIFAAWKTNVYESESQMAYPASTPVLGDGIHPGVGPKAADLPATDLRNGGASILFLGGGNVGTLDTGGYMSLLTIPRHGKRPSPVPRNWPTTQPLPGAINAVFFDGHGELVLLERLWQLYWHRNYQPPAKRPGLP
jgi:prepilin-type processing-associated H-X9-DG protein